MSGRKRIATETGAGQWGSAMALAGSFFGLEVKVYMVKVSYNQKPYRRMLMETWGAKVVASPSKDTNSGRAILAESPDSPGSLGIAISEAVEDAAARGDTTFRSEGRGVPEQGHQLRPRPPCGLPGFPRVPRDRDQRSGRGRGDSRGHQLRPRVGPQPRLPPSDGHRPRGDGADEAGGGLPRHRDRLLRGREQPRRNRLPLPARQDRGEEGSADRRGRALLLPDAHQGDLRIRLRGYRETHAAHEDVHSRPRLRARRDPRGGAAVPRGLGAHQPAPARGIARGPGLRPDRGVPKRDDLRPLGRDPSGARVGARHPLRDPRGEAT